MYEDVDLKYRLHRPTLITFWKCCQIILIYYQNISLTCSFKPLHPPTTDVTSFILLLILIGSCTQACRVFMDIHMEDVCVPFSSGSFFFNLFAQPPTSDVTSLSLVRASLIFHQLVIHDTHLINFERERKIEQTRKASNW